MDARNVTANGTSAPHLAARVAAEIRALRRGRGVSAARLADRLGPFLRELSGGSGTGPVDRPRLAAEIAAAAAGLADDVRAAVMASLGLDRATRHMTHLKDRVAWLADQLGCGYRTALRRIDAAESMVAEAIAHELLRRRGRTAGAPTGWYLDELRTVLRLDTPTPEAHEHRRIVATRDGLQEVMAWHDVLIDDERGPAVGVEVLYGGRLVRRERPSRSRFHFMVRLPAPLSVGDHHEYGLVVRPVAPMRPHYILLPECPCHSFTLRVRFAADRMPRWVRRVVAETVRMYDSAQPRGELLAVDDAGEVEVRFSQPTMYLGYGLQWEW
jgi:hypothetical protein